MSSATAAAAAAAPWRVDLLAHIEAMDEPSLTLATLHTTSSEPQQPTPTTHATARARTAIFRGMWAGLPVNPKNSAPLNPALYESDLPTITTDLRMDKARELGWQQQQPSASAGGSGRYPFEAVFWASSSRTQWRLRGDAAYVVTRDIDTPLGRGTREGLARYMRRSSGAPPGNNVSQDNGGWSWSRELTAHFGNLSPMMRGSFRNPPPGTPVANGPGGDGLGLGQTVDDLEDDTARANFCVVALVPDTVDRLDLSDPARARRWIYSRTDGGAWDTVEVWP